MSAEANSRKPFPWRAVTFWLIGIVLLGVLGFYSYFWNERGKADRRLKQVIAELDRDDPGWRLEDIESAREQVTDSENGAIAVAALSDKLPARWSPSALDEALFESAANEELSVGAFKAIADELQLRGSACADARMLVAFKKGRYAVDHQPDPSKTRFPHLDQVWKITGLLRLDALHAAQAQDFSRALSSCAAMVAVVRTIGDDSMSASHLTRIGRIVKACSTAERVLGQGVSTTEDLLALQSLLEREDAYHGLVAVFRTERGIFHRECETLLKSELKPGGLMGPAAASGPAWMPSREKERFLRAYAEALEVLPRFFDAGRQPMPVRGAAMKRVSRDVDDLRLGVLELFLPFYMRVEEADRLYHTRLRCAAAMLATERFRLKHNRWPVKIAELVEFRPSDTLIDPCDGKPMRLRREKDGLVIYSVGVNGVDDGGTAESLKPNGLDVGFRLWDVAKRRQPPKPPKPDPEGPEGPP